MHLKAFKKKAELDVTEAFKHKQIHAIINLDSESVHWLLLRKKKQDFLNNNTYISNQKREKKDRIKKYTK